MVGNNSQKIHWFWHPGLSISSKEIYLEGPEFLHAKARRIKRGEKIILFDGNGRIAECSVKKIEKEKLTVEIGEVREKKRESPEIKFYLSAFAQIKEFVRNASLFDNCSIFIFSSRRSTLKISSSNFLSKLQRSCIEGCKTSQNPFFPQIKIIDEREILADAQSINLILHPSAKMDISSILMGGEKFSFIIGPEGGFEEDEVKNFLKRGFYSARIWNNILTTELVPVFLAGFIKGLKK